MAILFYFTKLKASSSAIKITSLWNFNIDAGTSGLTGPSINYFTIGAFTLPEATIRMRFALMISPIPIV